MMDKYQKTGAVMHRVLAILLVVCFVQCATGSCLSYGHSCWGAHGKRSGKPPAAAPDWYITRILRRMAENDEMNREPVKNGDISAIFQPNFDEAPSTDKFGNNDVSIELPLTRNREVKPMLDDNMLSKMKIWQILRDAEEK